jgi:hypothetical protein
MTPDPTPLHPFADVDLTALDVAFPALLAHSDAHPPSHDGRILSDRERHLLRFGLQLGAGEWVLAADTLMGTLDAGLLTTTNVEEAVAEAAVVRGVPVCVHLGPILAGRGLHGPGSVADAVAVRRAAPIAAPPLATSSPARLTDRELFALGLGITWGARCWDT